MKIKDKYDSNFFKLFTDVVEIEKLRKDVIEKDLDDISELLIIRILKCLDDNYLKNDDHLFQKQIIYNFWNMLYLYYYQKTFSIQRSVGTLRDYVNCCSRILEFAIFINNNSIIISYKNKEIKVKDVFFDTKLIDVCFYKHFKKIEGNVKKNYKNLIFFQKDSNNEKKVFINNMYYYLPQSKPMEEIKNNRETFWFERLFRLVNDQINRIFYELGTRGSLGGEGLKKGTKLDYKELKEHENIEDQIYLNSDNKKISNEEDIESQRLLNEIPSLHCGKDKKIQSKLGINLKDSYVKDKYKQYLLNKAISLHLAKYEIFSPSKVVNINIFKRAIQLLINKRAFALKKEIENKSVGKNNFKHVHLSITIVLLSIFTGIKLNILISIFANKYKGIEFDNKFEKLIIHNNSIFAETPDDNEVLIPIGNNKSYVYLPVYIIDMIKSIKDKFKDEINQKDLEEYKKYVKMKLKIISKCLRRIFRKTEFSNFNIVATKSCHRAFYNYFRIFHSETDIRILLLDNLSKSDETKICYTNQPKRAIYYESWLNEFYNKLTANHYVLKENYEENLIGSMKVVKKHVFKNFLLYLTYLEPENEIQKFNLQMIFIRYSLSILLATRNSLESCNLDNFSEDLGLLIIHEKAKAIRSSRRLIPLNKRAVNLIKLFYELKEKFQISNNRPILLKSKEEQIIEEDLTVDEVKNFIKEFNDNSKYGYLYKFVEVVDLNFGRHIYATKAFNKGFDRDFCNEFMGHTSRGNSGLGIYSCFDLNKYISKTKEFIDEIEDEYFPSNIISWGAI